MIIPFTLGKKLNCKINNLQVLTTRNGSRFDDIHK